MPVRKGERKNNQKEGKCKKLRATPLPPLPPLRRCPRVAADGTGLPKRTTARDWASPHPQMEGMETLGRALAACEFFNRSNSNNEPETPGAE